MKTRSPRAVVTGLMWLQQREAGGGLRHTCEQGDGLASYGWLRHDGDNFGVQELRDRGLLLRTEFVKRHGGEHGGDWSWRVTARPEGAGSLASLVSLFFYVATDGQGTLQPHVEDRTRLGAVSGTSEELGDFRITFLRPTSESGEGSTYSSFHYLDAWSPGLHRLTDVVRSSLSDRFVFSPPGGPRQRFLAVDTFRGLPGVAEAPRSHLLLHQVTLRLPARVEVTFESGSVRDRRGPLAGPALTAELARHEAAFERRFEETFGLERKGFPPAQRRFAQAALSNMLGGMGYFHGRSLVQSPLHERPVPYPETSLFTAVPSRSFFPRGFLWDEGFHQLLLARWDPELSREVIAHWFDLMNAEGWIPREQILGEEALAKVPPEFVVQHSETANPPTLFLALQQLLGTAPLPYLRRLFPRLRAWYEWYNSTQAGPLPYTFRWRGRDTDPERFLNPKTLASGLDDYPRASHPSADERHLDLRCWMALASQVLAEAAERLGEPAEPYRHMQRALSDSELLERLHWAEELGAFADYGNHSRAVGLRREAGRAAPGRPPPEPRLVRVVREAPRPRFVGALGYVSLFPLLLQLLPPDSPRLAPLLAAMRSEKQLWTPFGLRSLARDSPLYMQRNTEHDPPYWRGSVWVNINYLALRALHAYGSLPGPHRERAAELYRELRHNLVANLYRQYADSGYLWEHYSDSSGAGQGSHPFTGWSALVVLVMAEDY
ncbi:mannosyl-oligosaccharide glucosidase [Anas platyrhynchos]|uniref:mannosyl-oligosaccharide glucosidase n=1 Tax=Anas platyrhynchos TaxID=8839 RepID=UPI003AF2534D